MDKINWKSKLSSRKFWGFVVVLVTALCVIFKAGEDNTQLVIGLVTAISDLIIFCVSDVIQDKGSVAK